MQSDGRCNLDIDGIRSCSMLAQWWGEIGKYWGL